MEEYSSYEKAVALIPKFPAFLSMFSSIFIVQHVLRDQKRRTHIYHRILCCMSISDIIGSIGLFLSTWPIPKGEAYLAAGNVRTCIAAGFFNQSATLCTPAYNVSLAIYYLLVVVKGWKENNIAKAEKYLHAFPIILGVGTGIAGIPLRLYNGAGLHLCWIQSGLPNHPENHNPHFSEYRVGFMYAMIWAIIMILAISMAIIYFHVLRQEKKMDKYSRQSVRHRSQSRQIRNQAFLYVGSLYICWVFGSVSSILSYRQLK